MNADQLVESYLADVRAHLGSATSSGEEEAIREVAVRIQALAAEPGATAESALEQLGPARKVAGQYRDALLIAKASHSNSPILLLQASLKNGVLGVLAFVAGLAGFWIGGCLLVFGTLALLWSAAHYTRDAKAAIGESMLQTLVTAVAGAIVVVITTLLLRTLLRTSKRMQLPR